MDFATGLKILSSTAYNIAHGEAKDEATEGTMNAAAGAIGDAADSETDAADGQ